MYKMLHLQMFSVVGWYSPTTHPHYCTLTCQYAYMYGTVQLQLHFYTRVHAWQHAVFRVCIA